MECAGKIVLVTGAQQGIGRAMAVEFAAAGADVAINWLDDEAAAERAGDEVRGHGRRVMLVKADIARIEQTRAMVSGVEQELGPIDVLINNAGVFPRVPFLEMTEGDWDYVLDVNLKGAMFQAKAAARHMIRQGAGGRQVHIGSVRSQLALRGRGYAAYCASKGGEIAFTRAAALDMKGKNIYINALAPALVDTPLNAAFTTDTALAPVWGKETIVGRWGKPSEVAQAALFLASDASDFVNGTVLTVDGGWTGDGTPGGIAAIACRLRRGACR